MRPRLTIGVVRSSAAPEADPTVLANHLVELWRRRTEHLVVEVRTPQEAATCDVVLLTVAEEELPGWVYHLEEVCRPGQVVAHVSLLQSLEVLDDLEVAGAFPLVLAPIREGEWVVEGYHEEALALAELLLEEVGGEVVELPAYDRKVAFYQEVSLLLANQIADSLGGAAPASGVIRGLPSRDTYERLAAELSENPAIPPVHQALAVSWHSMQSWAAAGGTPLRRKGK